MNIEDSCISCIDTDWSYQLARRMEKEKTNPVLGYRTAGSAAETATGDMLYREMKAIGLTDVTRDTFSLDGWEFEKAVLKFTDDSGQEHTFQMGGYQTNFETDGFEDYELVYLGKGTAADYEGINVKGKLVMVEINQRDEWWISFPVYQAYLRGAAALIAVQANGYGEIAETALNAVTASIEDALVKGEKVQLIGFGTFETRERKARQGRNPRQPEEVIQIEASKAPVFKAGKALKDAVNK